MSKALVRRAPDVPETEGAMALTYPGKFQFQHQKG